MTSSCLNHRAYDSRRTIWRTDELYNVDDAGEPAQAKSCMELSALDAAISFLSFLPPSEAALASLSPKVVAWLRAAYGEPTAIQRGSFGIVAHGQSALLLAATGTGKTLAAFLPLLDRLPADLPEGIVGLVITPLKALAADQFKNIKMVVDALAPQ